MGGQNDGTQSPKWHRLVAMNPVYVTWVSPLGMPIVRQAICPGPTATPTEYPEPTTPRIYSPTSPPSVTYPLLFVVIGLKVVMVWGFG